jgi:hypothetical protein
MIDHFLNLLGPFFQSMESRHVKFKDKSDAISALKDALRMTKQHISETRVEDFGDAESRVLSELWSKAARLIRPFDPIFAGALEDKSDYWVNPQMFKREIEERSRAFNYRFRIHEVEKRINEIEQNIR